MNIDVKLLNKILSNQIKQYVKKKDTLMHKLDICQDWKFGLTLKNQLNIIDYSKLLNKKKYSHSNNCK